MILSVILALLSLLAVFPAPTNALWYVAIGVTEAGHLGVLLALLVALGLRFYHGHWTAATGLALLAALLFLTPLGRAYRIAQTLPAQLESAFPVKKPPRAPLTFWRLFDLRHPQPVQESTYEFARFDKQTLSLDLYRPVEKSPDRLPLVVVVHGGSWKSGDRKEFVDFNRYWASRGFIVVSVDYRLAPQAIFPAQVDDVVAAIIFLKKQSVELGLDPQRIVLVGRSAGGQIALSAAYRLAAPTIRGVIAYYAPSDLIWGYANPTNPWIMNSCKVLADYLGGAPERVRANYEAASPVTHVDAKTPPTLMIHGLRDELVSPLHDEHLAERLRKANRPYYILRLPWATHGCDAFFSGPCGQLSTYAVEHFLQAVVDRR